MAEAEEKEIYIPEDWAWAICAGISWQHSEGDDISDAMPMLEWIAKHYPEIAAKYPYLI